MSWEEDLARDLAHQRRLRQGTPDYAEDIHEGLVRTAHTAARAYLGLVRRVLGFGLWLVVFSFLCLLPLLFLILVVLVAFNVLGN
jgi:hypothetical protein